MKYTVTLSHHSIARAPVYRTDTIEDAKRIGDEQFSGGFNDHRIVVRDQNGEIVASRLLADDSWDD